MTTIETPPTTVDPEARSAQLDEIIDGLITGFTALCDDLRRYHRQLLVGEAVPVHETVRADRLQRGQQVLIEDDPVIPDGWWNVAGVGRWVCQEGTGIVVTLTRVGKLPAELRVDCHHRFVASDLF